MQIDRAFKGIARSTYKVVAGEHHFFKILKISTSKFKKHCPALQHNTTLCNTLQHKGIGEGTNKVVAGSHPRKTNRCNSNYTTHCNTLQHTATH